MTPYKMGLLNPFWSFRLYIWSRHLSHIVGMFLLVPVVVIPDSGSVFRPIFDHGVPTRTLGMSTLTRSFTLISSIEVIFCHETLSWMTENGRIRSLSRKSSPRVTETVQNWVLWTKKCSWSWCGYFPIQDFYSFETDSWIRQMCEWWG